MRHVDGEIDRSTANGAKQPQNRAGRTLLLTSAIAGGLVLSAFAGILPAAFGIVAVALVLTTVFWLIRIHLPSILLVFVSVLLASVVATQRLPKLHADRMEAEEGDRLSEVWKASGKFDQNLPIVVHLVMDEMMSVGAMTDDLPGAPRTRQSLLEFGEKHSFRTFDSVYSRYYYTSDVLSNLMNREYLGRTSMDSFSQIQFNARTKNFTVEANAYFDDMAARGYRTVVFQTSAMDFCRNEHVDLCETFDSFDPGGANLDSATRRAMLWQTLIRAHEPSYASEIGQWALARVYGLGTREVGVTFRENSRYDIPRFPEWFDRFTRFAAAVPRGTHVFAHFMAPHSPYLLTESCVVSGKFEFGYKLSQYPLSKREERRRYLYERYLAQTRCVNKKLDSFMTAIGRSENFRDAVIIIHGDHGSRLSISDILEDYVKRDFVDNYSAFFAVRSPGVPAGLDCELVSLPEVFRRYVARGVEPRPLSGKCLPVVVISRAAGRKIDAPMPMYGCAAGVKAASH